MHRPATITLRVRPLLVGFRRPGRGPAAVLGAVLVGIATALAACSTQSPAQTTVEYQPADGIDVNLGAVDARGLVLVSAAKGAAGVLVGSLINRGSDPVTVTFLTPQQAQSSSSNGPSMQLKGNQQAPITGIQFESVQAAPGDLTNVVLQTKAGQVFANVPVLLPNGYYSAVTATSVPTSTSATSGSATSATSGSATSAASGSATSGAATGGQSATTGPSASLSLTATTSGG